MRTAMRPRYYCDYCNKGNGSASHMKKHERGCTANPQRECGLCRTLADAGGPEPAPPRDQLLRILNDNNFAAMREAANDCPACILSVLRTLWTTAENGESVLIGSGDGRETWEFRPAKEAWWADFNSGEAEKEHALYGY